MQIIVSSIGLFCKRDLYFPLEKNTKSDPAKGQKAKQRKKKRERERMRERGRRH